MISILGQCAIRKCVCVCESERACSLAGAYMCVNVSALNSWEGSSKLVLHHPQLKHFYSSISSQVCIEVQRH